MRVECICINSKNKPVIIPISKWIVENETYHIIHVGTTPNTKILTCTLSEISLGEESYPYEGFRLDRFAFSKDNFIQLVELMKQCSELNNFDINELIEENQLVEI